MKDPVEYQHFANLVERVAVYTERLENICKNLEQYKVEHKNDMRDLNDNVKNIDGRVRTLEDQSNKHHGGWIILSAIILVMGYAVTNYIQYRMAFPH